MNEEQLRNLGVAAEALHPLVEEHGGPLGIVGRVIGMGQAEVKAGIPKWAWLSIGVFTGAAAAYHFRRNLSALFESKD